MNEGQIRSLTVLFSAQEERLAKKIDDLHTEITEVKMDIKKINGRVRRTEIAARILEEQAKMREQTCGARLKGLEPEIKTMRVFNFVANRWKLVIGILITLTFFINILVETLSKTEAIAYLWNLIH